VAGKICPACKTPVQQGAAIVVCPACRTPHHNLCWQRTGTCAVPGCATQPAPTIMQPQAPPPSGACPKCGYVFGPLETTCRRCAAGLGPPIEQRPLVTQPQKKSSWGLLVAIFLVLVAVGGLVYFGENKQGGIKLEYKFKPGKEDKYNTTLDMNMNLAGGPPAMPKSINVAIGCLLLAKSVECEL